MPCGGDRHATLNKLLEYTEEDTFLKYALLVNNSSYWEERMKMH